MPPAPSTGAEPSRLELRFLPSVDSHCCGIHHSPRLPNHQQTAFPPRESSRLIPLQAWFWYELPHPETGSVQAQPCSLEPQNNRTSARFPPEYPIWTLLPLASLFLCPEAAELRQPLVVHTPPFPKLIPCCFSPPGPI